MLKLFHPLFISVHVNHPRELTTEARDALGRLADAGIPQAAAGNEEGDGFEQVGFAGAVRPGHDGDPRRRSPGEGAVATEIRPGEAGEVHRGMNALSLRERVG